MTVAQREIICRQPRKRRQPSPHPPHHCTHTLSSSTLQLLLSLILYTRWLQPARQSSSKTRHVVVPASPFACPRQLLTSVVPQPQPPGSPAAASLHNTKMAWALSQRNASCSGSSGRRGVAASHGGEFAEVYYLATGLLLAPAVFSRRLCGMMAAAHPSTRAGPRHAPNSRQPNSKFIAKVSGGWMAAKGPTELRRVTLRQRTTTARYCW